MAALEQTLQRTQPEASRLSCYTNIKNRVQKNAVRTTTRTALWNKTGNFV